MIKIKNDTESGIKKSNMLEKKKRKKIFFNLIYYSSGVAR